MPILVRVPNAFVSIHATNLVLAAASPAATASPAKGKKRKAAAASDGREDGAGATPAKTRAKVRAIDWSASRLLRRPYDTLETAC